MPNTSPSRGEDVLRTLLGAKGLERVAIVDDVFDAPDEYNLSYDERLDLWSSIEFHDQAQRELAEFHGSLHGADDLTDELICGILREPSRLPAFVAIWNESDVGVRTARDRLQVDSLIKELRDAHGLEVKEFGSDVKPSDLIDCAPQLLFLDWFLGHDVTQTVDDLIPGEEPNVAVQAAVNKAKGILLEWPDEEPKPLIVLMSSRLGVEKYAGDFCRRSGILRGMFHAVPKSMLADSFLLRMHLQSLAKSLPVARRLQLFVDALHVKFEESKTKFLAGISELTLNDYAYIQSLSLQDDGQPLGDYLFWLFSAYFGQLLFAEALRDEREALDLMTFSSELTRMDPPSERLTTVYHSAIFDTSVGEFTAHPLDTTSAVDSALRLPMLTLGDVLMRQSDPQCDENALLECTKCGEGNSADSFTSCHSQERTRFKPDLFMVINAQCDLALAPASRTRASDPVRSILLLPGFFKSVLDPAVDNSKPKTELYRYNGEAYRVEWETKKIQSIPYGQFNIWKEDMGYERVARLRLPFALEVQRAFAADLTRVGMPVMPPIYQTLSVQILSADHKERTLSDTGQVGEDEAAFLVLTKEDDEIRQRCVFTLPLVARLRRILEQHLKIMQTNLAAEAGSREHLQKQIESLKRAIADHVAWTQIGSPFDWPKPNGFKDFLSQHIQVARGKRPGDVSARSLVTVSLESGGVSDQEGGE